MRRMLPCFRRRWLLPARYFSEAVSQKPTIWDYRLKVWESLKKVYCSCNYPHGFRPHTTSLLPLQDGVAVTSTCFAPQDMSQELAVVLDGAVHDLHSSIADCPDSSPVTFDDAQGEQIFWHSAAHILGLAIETHFAAYDVNLRDGPPLDDGGFYYDVLIISKDTKQPVSVTPDDLKMIEKIAEKICQVLSGAPLCYECGCAAVLLFESEVSLTLSELV